MISKPPYFYMDMRTFGKDYELYYNRSKQTYGVQFRALSAPLGNPGLEAQINWPLSYATDASETVTEQFDMVVLSTGFRPTESARELARVLDIELTNIIS
jgi:heterodisulfide reductase subunit A